jgi:glycoside hydrolase-like protein
MSRRSLLPSGLLGLVALGAFVAPALLGPGSAEARTVHFEGQAVAVPKGWPAYRLGERPGMCVRMDRRAVYLGTPAADMRCPAEAMGRKRAILVEGASASRARASALPSRARLRAAASAGGSVFTGLGFDACTAPSSQAMSAWKESPYRAVGVYIGGLNRGCSQPNLTSSWVSKQTEAGWFLIPTYVGLQAPTSACSSCAKINPAQATAQGNAAASDAVAQAAALGMGPGSPIYNDMEAYTQTSSATGATLAFLEAWTEKLHSLGYVSGVYSSSGSGIEDLVDQIGTGYNLPDHLWFANWNGQASSTDSYIPSYAWNQHQRIHQYRGGHDERYGGVTINIDNNYVDGATVGNVAATAANEDPIGRFEVIGSPAPGQLRVRGWTLDKNVPTQPLAIRVYVGGRAGAPGALAHELGPVASVSRPDVGAKYRASGPNHGFDTTFATTKSGAQPVCVYALNTGPGKDRLLGCKDVAVPVAVTISNPRATVRGVRARLACEWPEGTRCPGRLSLRTQVRVAVPGRRRRQVRLRTVTRSLGNRPFQLTGKRSHAFTIPYSAGGRALLQQHGELRTQLIAAIPGGRRIVVLRVGG